ncbi:MAG TPA: tetratricopeptide repeat protein [Vicinamibacterales bacterium]|jgi:tetratricopeptide (TPR) repeat protein
MKRHALLFLVVAVAATGCRRSNPPADRQSMSLACQVALAAGRQDSAIDRSIADLQKRAGQPVHRRETLEQLGYQFVARARTANDPGDYKLAESAAICLDEQYPGDPAALLLRGHALHQLHRFREAEAIARTLVARREYVLDYALLGDALMEQGRLVEAAAAYQKMIDLKPFYQSYTRAAHLRWLTGDLDGAVDLVRKAIDAASPRNPESVAWAYARLALYELQRGNLEGAAQSAAAALRFQPDYAAALLMQGRVFLANGRAEDAVRVLERAAGLNPLPEYQWTLADALRRRQRDPEAAAVEQEIVERGPVSDPRTVALFLSTRRVEPSQALLLTERELAVRKDVFTQDARAWALATAGRMAEARAAMTTALSEHTKDARLFLHAGVIAASTGRRADARRWLAQADALRSTLLPSELDILRRYQTTSTNNHSGE